MLRKDRRRPQLLEPDAVWKGIEQPDAAAEQIRCNVHQHLVAGAGGNGGLAGRGAAQLNILAVGDAGLFDGADDAIRDEGQVRRSPSARFRAVEARG